MRTGLIAVLMLACSSVALAVPSQFSVQGVLRDGSGTLQSMPIDVSVSLFDAQTAGTKLAGPFATSSVPVSNGLFTVPVSDATLTTALGSASEVWLEVTIGSDVFDRQKVTPQIFALMCKTADAVKGLTILPNGNVGLGTSSPQAQLDIESDTGAREDLVTFSSDSAAASHLLFERGRGTAASPADVQNGDTISRIYAFARGNSLFREASSIISWVDGSPTADGVPGSLAFSTSDGTQQGAKTRMVIKSSGNVGIGTTTPLSKLTVEGTDESPNLTIRNLSSSAARFPGVAIYNYAGATNGTPSVSMLGHRGTFASPAPVQVGDVLGQLIIQGQIDTTQWHTSAAALIQVLADGNFSSSSSPGAIAFSTTNTGSVTASERMRIANDGKVGIGTQNPTAALHVSGSGPNGGNIVAQSTDSATSVAITGLSKPGLQDTAFLAFSDGDVADTAFIGLVGPAGAGSGAAGDVRFTVGNGERMRISKTGSLAIGTTVPDALLSVNGTASKVGGGSWATYSDERLKDIKGSFTAGLDAVMKLSPIRYRYKADNALGIPSSGEHVGFSAQAVQKVIPEAVTTNSRGYLMVDNDPIIFALLNAVKEQQAENRALRERLERLEQRLDQRLDRRAAR